MKYIYSLLFLVIINLFTVKDIYASDFLVEAEVDYNLLEDSKVEVIHQIRLENLSTEVYAKEFSFTLSGISIQDLEAYEDDKQLDVTTEKINGNNVIKIAFENNLVGINKFRYFTVKFIDDSLLSKTGDVWEINIPKLASPENFDTYDLSFKIPNSFGEVAYIVPNPRSKTETNDFNIYYFNKNDLVDAGVTVAIGEYQSFSFNLSYHLENPLLKSTTIEIALPPDTPFQQLYYEQITPKPKNIRVTEEGNWMAEYKLASRERLDINVIGYVKIFAGPRYSQSVDPSVLEMNLKPSQFWQTDDEEIKRLASELKTPENIYNYVVKSLKYNYENVTPTTKRLGASQALIQANQAICTEFTDLFIAISRAAGIPAREVNGYAATENPTLQPLSLVADVLHAWPEYWDYERSIWVPVDPTWGHTTGGSDYFSKLDLRHFAFVFHGISPTEPAPPGSYKLGSNPQKDVYVNFSKVPEFEDKDLIFDIKQEPGTFFRGPRVIVQINNPSPVAIYQQKVKVSYDGTSEIDKNIDVILPFSEKKVEFVIPHGLFGSKMPENVVIQIGDFQENIKPIKNNQIIIGFSLIILIITILIIFIFIYSKDKFIIKK